MLIKDELKFINKLKKLEKYNIDILNDIEQQLQRGEKFEKMWRELRALKKVGRNPEIIVKELEQKYFPEEVNK